MNIINESVCVPVIREAMDEARRVPTRQPVFAFGMHKGGSTMLADFFNIYTKRLDHSAISISDILFYKGIGDETYRNDAKICDLLDDKFVYYGFRYVPDFMLANKARYLNRKAIMLVRDPRDCVVSAYYSFLKSHVVASESGTDAARSIQKERDEHGQSSIDDYALSETIRFVEEMCDYAYFMHENARLFRYEDIIFNKRQFFTEALEHLGLPLVNTSFEEALKRVDVLPDKEQADKHIRSVKPGNHAEKLSKETVLELNRKFADVLSLFGYA